MTDPRIIARDGTYYIRARDLRPGDLLDLEGDPYADPRGDSLSADGEHFYGFEYELAEVVEPVEFETPTCVVVHTDMVSCGFPPDHEINVSLADKQGRLQP
jgi:hypothetical protein